MIEMEKRDWLQEHLSFWPHLSETEQEVLCAGTQPVHYKKGQNVHSGSNDCVGVVMVRKGCLRTYMLSEDGREVTLYRLEPGDICVLSASCVLETITFDVFVDADVETDIYLLSSAVFHRLTEENIYVSCAAYELATTRFSQVMWAMQQILFMKVDQRLAIFLWDESAKTGSDTLKLTHEQVAKYMGSAREVVTRMLKYFAKEGIVTLSRGTITITDRDKLRQLI